MVERVLVAVQWRKKSCENWKKSSRTSRQNVKKLLRYSKCHFSCDSGMGTSTRISDLLPIKFCMEKRQINFSNLNSAAAMPIIAGDLFRVQFKTKFSYFDHHCILTAVVAADLFRLWFKLWSTEVSKAILDRGKT